MGHSIGYDTDIATQYRKCVRAKGDLKHNPKRTYAGIIVHNTGLGVISRWKREQRHKTPFKTAMRIYCELITQGPHYVVGQRGECAQVLPEEYVAWHVGTGKERAFAYRRPPQVWRGSEMQWWADRYPKLKSPLQMAGGSLWANGSVNVNTIGIEVVHPDGPAGTPWSLECNRRLARLINDIAERRGININPETVVSHSEVHPLTRTKYGRPWDAFDSQWNREVWRRFKNL